MLDIKEREKTGCEEGILMGNGNSAQPFLCAVDRGSALLYLMLFIHTVYIEKKKVEKHEHIPRT